MSSTVFYRSFSTALYSRSLVRSTRPALTIRQVIISPQNANRDCCPVRRLERVIKKIVASSSPKCEFNSWCVSLTVSILCQSYLRERENERTRAREEVSGLTSVCEKRETGSRQRHCGRRERRSIQYQ